MKNKKAFTLIEILVVITILAGFMAMLVPNFMQARVKSRDMRRKSDLKAIQKALELYKLNQSTPVYPAAGALVACSSLSSGGVIFMQLVPQDPLGQCPTVSNAYSYTPSVDLGSYALAACLENANDPDAGSCPGAPFTCLSTKCYQLTQP